MNTWIFLFHFVYVVAYINKFLYNELSRQLWDEAWLSIVDEFFLYVLGFCLPVF